jgi:hypothetical protein
MMRSLLFLLVLGAGGAFVYLAWLDGGEVPWLQAWFLAALFWLGPALGALFLLLAWRIGGGAWAGAAAPRLAAMTATLPLPLIAFVPLLIGMSVLLPWVAPTPDLAGMAAARAPWTSVATLWLRTGVIFAGWLGIGWWAIRGRPSPPWAVAASLAVLATLMLFVVDWVLGLTPGWSTDTLPLAVAIALVLVTPAVLVVTGGPDAQRLAPWLYGGALFLVYLLFVQYLVVWTGNLPDQVTWYLARRAEPWSALGMVAFSALSIVGLAGLITPGLRAGGGARIMALILLVADALALAWMIMPAFAHQTSDTYVLTALAFIALGGLWGLVDASLGDILPRGEVV